MMKRSTVQSGSVKHGWVVSAVFWFCLLLSAGLYGLVALAPKWQTYQLLEVEHRANQYLLVSLEQDVDHLQKMVRALEHDPAFAAELTRIDFGAVRPDEERIEVNDALKLNIQSSQQLSREPVAREAKTSEVVRLFAQKDELRQSTLIFCGVLVLLAFGFLIVPGETGPGDLSDAPLVRLLNRYRKR